MDNFVIMEMTYNDGGHCKNCVKGEEQKCILTCRSLLTQTLELLEQQKNDREELLKFVSGEFIESSIVQRLLGISFEECMTRFILCRRVEWNKAPLNGQEITNYFRIPTMEKQYEGRD